MGNFPLTRIALNLSLIVALAIQPVAACAVTAVCSGCLASDTVMCPGCGCCEVANVDDRCCCCSGAAKVWQPELAEPSCCSHDESADTEVFETAPSDPHESNSGAPKSGVQLGCSCEQNQQPLSDSSPQRPINENRTSIAIGYAGPVGADFAGRLAISAARDQMPVPALARFAQIVLCIWRL